MFQPVMRLLLRVGLPRMLAALIIVLFLVSLFLIVGLLLSGPLAQLIGFTGRAEGMAAQAVATVRLPL